MYDLVFICRDRYWIIYLWFCWIISRLFSLNARTVQQSVGILWAYVTCACLNSFESEKNLPEGNTRIIHLLRGGPQGCWIPWRKLYVGVTQHINVEGYVELCGREFISCKVCTKKTCSGVFGIVRETLELLNTLRGGIFASVHRVDVRVILVNLKN
jgi:hypothetical protein